MMTSDNRPATATSSRRFAHNKVVRRETIIGWLFVLPALVMYAVFVLLPLLLSIQYSVFRWDGIGPMTWAGLNNYATVLEDPDLLGTIFNAFKLVVFFSFIPVSLGLVVASIMHRVASGRLGTVARTVLFLPQVIPLVAAGIIWG
jgi:raffinose/stachyose/melibiose transport system permease protein